MSNSNFKYSDVKDIPTRAMLNLRGAGASANIPNQATPLSRRGPKFYKDTMEGMERMALKQVRQNVKYNDSYAQIEGRVIVTQFLNNITKEEKFVGTLLDAEDYDIPEYIRNYDKIGPIVKHIATKYVEISSNYNVDFIDPTSQNEFDRELNNRLMQSTIQRFKLEKLKREVMWGIQSDMEDIPEEERESYMQQIEAQMKLISSPEEILSSTQKEWKPAFIRWINNKLKMLDRDRSVKKLYTQFVIDYLSSGKYFKEHISTPDGNVSVKRWDPRFVFHTQSKDLEYPQNANIIGIIDKISVDNVITEHGGSLTEKEIKDLIKFRDTDFENAKGGLSKENLKDVFYGNRKFGIFPGTFANEALSKLESRTGIPQTFVVKDFGDSNIGIKSEFINDYMSTSNPDVFFREYTRRDIGTEDDVILRTRAYWTSYEKVSFIFLEEDGVLNRYFVDERLLKDFVDSHELENLSNVTIDELNHMEEIGDVKPNTICSTLAPVTYYGVLLRTEGFGLNDDKIIETGPTKIQLRGDGNDIYKELKPVTGIISQALVPQWMPYQQQINYNLNLARKYAEKELGQFFTFDIGLLSPELSETGNIQEDFLDFQDRARNDAIVPVDASRKNLREGRGMEINPIKVQEVQNIQMINSKMQQADYWFRQLYQTVGITPQVVDQPSKYVTAEGLKQSQDATETNLDYIYNNIDDARTKDNDIYLRLLQYNQAGKDKVEFEEVVDDDIQVLREFFDPYLVDRLFKLQAINTPERRKKLEQIRQWLLQDNTLQDDTTALAEMLLSDDYTTLIHTMRKAKAEREAKEQQRLQEDRQHELQINEQNQQTAMQQLEFQQQAQIRKEQASLKEKVITELIRSYRNNGNGIPQETVSSIKDMIEAYKANVNTSLSQQQVNLQAQKIDNQQNVEQRRLEQQQQRIDNERNRIEQRERERNSDNFRSILKNVK